MVSSTQQTERIRKRKHRTSGKQGKRARRRIGTPEFPIHPVRYDLIFERLIQLAQSHVVSILILDPAIGLHDPQCVIDQGSGVLLRTESSRFILTAKHVVDGYRNKPLVAALGATAGQPPRDITRWTIIDESGALDVATIAVPRDFDERDIGKTALRVLFPLPRVQKGDPVVFFGFAGLHRRPQPGALRVALSAVSDFVVSVSDRGFVIADEKGEREVIEFTKGLAPFGPTGGVSGGNVFVQRGGVFCICGVVYEGGEGSDAWFWAAHADFLQLDGSLDHTRIPFMR